MATITPSITYSETGEEILDYDNAEIDFHHQGAINEFNRESYLVEDPITGEMYHQFADVEDPEQFDEDYEDLEVDEDQPERMSAEDYEAVADSAYEYCGGEENYNLLISWAQQNCSQEFINYYDYHIEGSDPNVAWRVFMELSEMFQDSRD